MLEVKYKGYQPNKEALIKRVCSSYKGEYVGAEFSEGFRKLKFKFEFSPLQGGAVHKLENMGYEVIQV